MLSQLTLQARRVFGSRGEPCQCTIARRNHVPRAPLQHPVQLRCEICRRSFQQVHGLIADFCCGRHTLSFCAWRYSAQSSSYRRQGHAERRPSCDAPAAWRGVAIDGGNRRIKMQLSSAWHCAGASHVSKFKRKLHLSNARTPSIGGVLCF